MFLTTKSERYDVPLDIARLKLVTSNKNKLAEYRGFGLTNLGIHEGVDLPEVDGTPDEVVIHKAIAAGEGNIVEDTILVVDGKPVVDIRWQLDALNSWLGKSARWEVRLGLLMNDEVRIFHGAVEGRLVRPSGEGFGFDPFFEVEGVSKTLAELSAAGLKVDYSARRIAVDNLVSGKHLVLLRRGEIPEWTGRYQH